MDAGEKWTVFSIRQSKPHGSTVWVKAGVAFANKDGSINVYLDVLPIDGKLHIRKAADSIKQEITEASEN